MISFNKERFISTFITKRPESLFAADWTSHKLKLEGAVAGKTIMVVGGAGSIGSQFIKCMLRLQPAGLIVVDHNENGLTELTRDLRSDPNLIIPETYKTYPVNFGHPVFRRILSTYPIDIVANFAAHKHVRSEKDHIAIEAMLDNNVFFVDALLTNLAEFNISHTFCVSTDKAANPANVMGATKQLMEQVIRSHTDQLKITTARFANVAFSNGSLLDGFLYRMQKKQPLTAPNDVKRYFVSPEESGQLCAMTCILGSSGDIFFPKIPVTEMMTFSEIAEAFLAELGKKPIYCETEEGARNAAKHIKASDSAYPVYFFTTDTSGEKAFEEFYTDSDEINLDKYKSMGVINTKSLNRAELKTYLYDLRVVIESDSLSKNDIVQQLMNRLQGFQHVETGKSLDDKM